MSFHLKTILLPALVIWSYFLPAQDSSKTIQAIRISSPPKIDGLLDDEIWKNAKGVSDFIQNSPYEGAPPAQKTEVKILYDDFAIYIGAMLYDTAPDSIYKELGNRDDHNLNAEKFRFVFDPYMRFQDAYEFTVYSSGVQADLRWSDPTYNAVWQSAVKILDNGWSVEMKIPYSAFRFPVKQEQKWLTQFTRDIRRTREFDQWALTPSGKANPQKYWGTIQGISDIKSPLRLSLSPYLSSYLESAPAYKANGTYDYSTSFSYNAGADIKYGLNESFTIDMTLLPDFGQVQSDNKVKNLSYREIAYEDYRPFFKESVELFSKDNLFYSRRIGKIPSHFYSVSDSLKPGESIEKNPAQTKLLNALKISGRTNKGLGVGFFNAITDNTYATIKDSSGKKRKILTEPLSNYNAIVFDQQLKNSSNAYIINTNVIREGKKHRDANVTSSGFSLHNKKNTWAVDGNATISHLFIQNDSTTNNSTNQTGYAYNIGIRKTSGTLQYSLSQSVTSNSFDRSDMGYQSIGNWSFVNGWIGINRYKPWKFILRSFNDISINYNYNHTTKLPTDIFLNAKTFSLTKGYWGIWAGSTTSPLSGYDYYEPRTEGKYFRTAEWYYVWAGFSSNYKYRFAVDISFNTGNFLPKNIHGFPLEQGWEAEFKPRFRASDKLSFLASTRYNFDPLNPGFANTDSNGDVIFGGRRLNTYTNTFSAKYIFKNDLSLLLNGRHYWITGEYRFYYTLLDNGMLSPNFSYSGNNNFSYNAFNIDAVFSWQFSSGSIFSVVYKNAVETSGKIIPKSFSDNFSSTLEAPQANSISLKVLYYLDYQQIKRKGVVN